MQLPIIIFLAQIPKHNFSLKIGRGDKSLSLNGHFVIHKMYVHKKFFTSGVFLVQTLNSSFFPPNIGAEPGRAKRESRITCMRILRIPPFFPPNRGKNYIWKYFPDLVCSAISLNK